MRLVTGSNTSPRRRSHRKGTVKRAARVAAAALNLAAMAIVAAIGAPLLPWQLIGGALIALGLALSWSGAAETRRRGWEISAIGLASCALGVAGAQ